MRAKKKSRYGLFLNSSSHTVAIMLWWMLLLFDDNQLKMSRKTREWIRRIRIQYQYHWKAIAPKKITFVVRIRWASLGIMGDQLVVWWTERFQGGVFNGAHTERLQIAETLQSLGQLYVWSVSFIQVWRRK